MRYDTVETCSHILEKMKECETVKTNRKIEYLNLSVSFDIETSSFIDYLGNKTAIMYIWMVCVDGDCIVGRSWDEFMKLCAMFSEYSELSDKKRLIVYVHNLSYEFQFIRKWFTWLKVFAIDTRKPAYALCSLGIEFRCSYLLSGYSLQRLGDELKTHDVKKLTGNLDYKLLRHSETPLTDDEMAYCLNDVLVVCAYINERIETDGDITRIPLTKTGYVRRFCKENCLGKGKKKDTTYKNFMKSLRIGVDEYSQLKRAFQGGFTHANPFYSGKVVNEVSSYDFTSSYPTVMVAEKFPMTKSEEWTPKSTDEFHTVLALYNVVFDVLIEGLNSTVLFDNYLSLSRCWGVVNATVNNGRVVSADRLYTTLTETDYFILCAMYEWESLSVAHARRYMKSYLPSKFVSSILTLYADKTSLKNVPGREYDYARSKEMLNSAYGMIVTDICRDDISYDDDWKIEQKDSVKQLKKYNDSVARFLYYPWGVWVTAYSRRNLFTGILECANDYVYSDTDSIKILNGSNHVDYIERYNENILNKLDTALRFHGFDNELIAPKTIKGDRKPLGVWDYEGTYTRFKTLGAKRYLTDSNGKLQLTVSGLNKRNAIEYLKSISDDVFDVFTDEMYIPKGHTGKLIHTYIDERRDGTVEDYTGIVSEYSELSSVHLDDADYSLKISHQYADYLMGIEHKG